MSFLVAVLIALLFGVSIPFSQSWNPTPTHILKESMINGNAIKKLYPSLTNTSLTLVIAITQSNLSLIEDLLIERSTPGNVRYQDWLTLDEIGNMTYNPNAFRKTLAWLQKYNVSVLSIAPRNDYITADASVETWQNMFLTTLYVWEDNRPELLGMHYNLAETYHIPVTLNSHITSIMGICQVPPVLVHHSAVKQREKLENILSTPTTVAQLNSLYGISSNVGSSSIHQSVFETNNQNFEQSDLLGFQKYFRLTQQAATTTGITPLTSGCTINACAEGSLDIQYIMGIAQTLPTIYWHVNSTNTDAFIGYLTAVAATTNPPTVLSISWGANENQVPASYLNAFNTEALKLSLAGVTIFASAGDDGVAGPKCKCSADSSTRRDWSGSNTWSGQGYFPGYPATSPYVVAVGATMGPEAGNPEVACESDSGGVITSGGGFSQYNRQPSWQSSAVATYLNSTEGQNAAPGYNPQGRGYPDISFIGVDYQVEIAGKFVSMYGTSASTPVAAALVSLVNSNRQKAGLSTVGFINPSLYANPSFFNDITSGANSCCEYGRVTANTATCCSSGFQANAGWDPVTGLGSISFSNFYALLTSESTVPPSFQPTATPSILPIGTTSEVPATTPRSSTVPTRAPLSLFNVSLHSSRTPSLTPTATSYHSETPSSVPAATLHSSWSPTSAPVLALYPSRSPSSASVVTPYPSECPSTTPIATRCPSGTPSSVPSLSTYPSHTPRLAPIVTSYPSRTPVSASAITPHPSWTATSSPNNIPLTNIPSLLSSLSPLLMPSYSPSVKQVDGVANSNSQVFSPTSGADIGIIAAAVFLACSVVLAVVCYNRPKSKPKQEITRLDGNESTSVTHEVPL